jgi:tetratricopeptide (TPR) repeat protein
VKHTLRIRSLSKFADALLFTVMFAFVPFTSGQTLQGADNDPDLQRAARLYGEGKMVEAMPLYEKLSADHPADLSIKERWAYAMASYSATLSDPADRKKVRVRARKIALEAQQAGDNSPLLFTILDWIPEDGTEASFSQSHEVDASMKAAEADFVRGDLEKARDGYIRTLLLDPKNYHAALFIGDIYFRQHIYGSAGEWFSRAIEIDSNQETAYRYWGDALTAANKMDEARSKFIEAVIAEPYNRLSFQGLNQWAQRNKVTLNWVRLQDKSQVTQMNDKQINVTLDDSLSREKNDPNSVAWVTYAICRAAWRGTRFKDTFPKETTYRHTMKEEAEALDMIVKVLKEQKDFKKIATKLDPALRDLITIDEAGWIEPFALLNRADNEIALDYVAYRDANREKVRHYLADFVVPKSPAASQ